MRFGIVLFGLIILLLLTAVLPVSGGRNATDIYYSPVMIVLLALLSGSSVWCCIKRKFSLKQVGFYLVHLGIVVILVGAFIGYVSGKKGMLQLSLMPQQAESRLMMKNGEPVDFGFEVAAENFQVKFYPPIYHLYRQIPPEQMVPGQMPFEKVSEFEPAGQTVLMLDDFGSFDVSNLWNEARQEWIQRRTVDAGVFLHRASQTPSYFGVTLLVEGEKIPISINHPAGYKGWRFYLMSYDQVNQRFVQLSARHDPGRNAVIVGIWLTLIGTFVLCFRRIGGAS
jgi:hypothetical protein